jgi:hypothetical protein
MPCALRVDPGAHTHAFVEEGQPNPQYPQHSFVPCFEVADVEVFQVI